MLPFEKERKRDDLSGVVLLIQNIVTRGSVFLLCSRKDFPSVSDLVGFGTGHFGLNILVHTRIFGGKTF